MTEEIKTIELEKTAEFQIGDITIYATAHYADNEDDCFVKISDILKEEICKKPY